MPQELGPGERLAPPQRERIELEVVSSDARLRLTRLLRKASDDGTGTVRLIRQNAIINIANAVLHRPIYVLNADDWGEYEPVEGAWHQGELELILRRPETAVLIEVLGDLIDEGWLIDREVNT